MSKVRDSVEDLRIIDDKAPIDNPSFTGPVTATGDTTIGAATAATNVQLILNGVASKAQRIKFAESGVDKWFIGQGAASETDAFEIYNANGQMSLSIAKATSNASFSGSLIASGGVYLGGTGAANKLDDYEEGTWTPNVLQGGFTITISYAKYVKIGRQVNIVMFITTASGGDANELVIDGLPFNTPSNGYATGIADTGGNYPHLVRTQSASNQLKFKRASLNTWATGANLDASHIILSLTYQTA